MASRTAFSNRTWVFLGYTVAVVLWGAFVRASLSGDGCGDHWPLCNGVAFPTAPSLKTKVELTHRVTSGLCWFGALAMALLARRHFSPGHGARRASAMVLFLMTTEALIGAGLVVFKLVADNPATGRGYWMAAHLTNTFLLLGAITWTAWASAVREPVRRLGRLPWYLGLALLGVLVVGVTGAVAALGDTLFPAESLAHGLAQDVSPTAHLFVRRRIWHPGSAIAVAIYLMALSTTLARRADSRQSIARVVASLTIVQIGVGLANVWLLAPVWMQLVHLAVADALWVALVWLALLTIGSQPGSDATMNLSRQS